MLTPQQLNQLLRSQAQASENQSKYARPQIHRVPPELRLKSKQNDQVYDPVIVSIGPYHHGKPELQRAQEFKYHCLDWCTSGRDYGKALFYNKILEIINELRGCYADVSCVNKYDDQALALIMLLDACFIINFMVIRTERGRMFHSWCRHLGMAAVISFTAGDIMLLENQIPFKVLQLITGLLKVEEESKFLIEKFLGWMMLGNSTPSRIPGGEERPPFHILEACYRVIASPEKSTYQEPLNFRSPARLMGQSPVPVPLVRHDAVITNYDHKEMATQTGNSVMDLKAKGISVKPSSSTSIRDIKFRSYAFHGQLQLPISSVSEITRVLLSNMLAFEISPGCETDLVVLSYISFMKSLIESPDDVKELQKKGILMNQLVNHEEVVKLFKEINTFGFFNLNFFSDVNQQIREHCNSKAKTWMADLINTWFRSPWTFIALLAASLLLCLTFMQTYFTIHPAKGN